MKETIRRLSSRYEGLFRAGMFGIASGIGFLIAEVILTIGVLVLFGTVNVKTAVYASPGLLELNILALSVGVTVSFFVNQSSTVKNRASPHDNSDHLKDLIVGLLKFQLVSSVGNALIIGVQLLLLREFSISPSIGNIIGALISFPFSYFVSMRYVWKIIGANAAPINIRNKITNNTGIGV
jgi:putative flippase GtrA